MKANRFANNDEGVSAVIGVILMVAITVILAAVIAAFVFGMVGGVKKQYTVSFTVARDQQGNVLVNNMGGNDANKLKTISIAYTPAGSSTSTYLSGYDTSGTPAVGQGTLDVGASATIGATDATGQTHVVVTGYFNDGTTQVLSTSDV